MSVSDASDNLMFPDSTTVREAGSSLDGSQFVCFLKSSCKIKFDDVFDYSSLSVLPPALVCNFHLIYSADHQKNGPPTGALSFWRFIPISSKVFLPIFAF